MNGVELLSCAILEQAIEDYKYLKSGGTVYTGGSITEYKRESTRERYINELERFFKGSWCRELMSVLDCKFNGREILEMLQSLQENPREVAV